MKDPWETSPKLMASMFLFCMVVLPLAVMIWKGTQ